jgi:hypothetical protein
MLTHDEDFCFPVLRGVLVEAERTAVKQGRARLLVVVEAEPDVRELADFGVVLAPPKIDDVRDAQSAEPFHMAASPDRTAEG